MPDAEVWSAFGVTSLPCLVVIDRTGTVRLVAKGSTPEHARELVAEFERLLAE